MDFDQPMHDLASLLGMNYAEFSAYVLQQQRALFEAEARVDRLLNLLDLNPEWEKYGAAELRHVLGAGNAP